MSDLSHVYGEDLTVDATGDLAIAQGSELGTQRVLRRLLTNPGSYIWSLDYGGGLATFLGHPAVANRMSAITRAQMFLEAAVARTPTPAIKVQAQPDGTVIISVRYADAATNTGVSLTLPITG